MLRRFFKLIAGSLLALIGIGLFIAAIKFNNYSTPAISNHWDPCAEVMLVFAAIVGGYGVYLAYSGWNPEAAEKLVAESNKTFAASMAAKTLRYVVLHHEGFGEPHFDLMFETAPGSDLLTWRSADWPLKPQTVLTPIDAHRRAYLDYEGEVSGGRGTVRRIHAGIFQLQQNDEDVFVGVLDIGDSIRFKNSCLENQELSDAGV